MLFAYNPRFSQVDLPTLCPPIDSLGRFQVRIETVFQIRVDGSTLLIPRVALYTPRRFGIRLNGSSQTNQEALWELRRIVEESQERRSQTWGPTIQFETVRYEFLATRTPCSFGFRIPNWIRDQLTLGTIMPIEFGGWTVLIEETDSFDGHISLLRHRRLKLQVGTSRFLGGSCHPQMVPLVQDLLYVTSEFLCPTSEFLSRRPERPIIFEDLDSEEPLLRVNELEEEFFNRS